MAKTAPTNAERRAELVNRLPVLLQCLMGAIAEDEGDNPATYVLASVALEASRELQELQPPATAVGSDRARA